MSMQRTTLARGAAATGASTTVSATGARPLDPPVRRARLRSIVALGLVSAVMVLLGLMWSIVAQHQLASALAGEGKQHLAAAQDAFTYSRMRVQADLQSHCRVMVEDPRLKATLATEGMDVATVADILQDLLQLRGVGFLMVLSPDGKVFAEAGAPELRGLDLSGSTVVKKALATGEAAVGSWVLGSRVMDLSTMTIRYGDQLVAYLVVGQAVDDAMMRAIAAQTGVHVASALANKLVASSATTAPAEAEIKRVLESVAATPGAVSGSVVEVGGTRYVTSAIELGETAQAHRLVLARPLADGQPGFSELRWMLFVPPLLVAIAVVFSTFGIRLFRRT